MTMFKNKSVDFYIFSVIWFIFFVVTPFYFFPSGSPQVADAVMVFLIVITGVAVILGKKFKIPYSSINIIIYLLLFVLNVIVVSVIWSLVLKESSILIYPLYYIYRFIILLMVLLFYSWYGGSFIKVILFSIAASVLLQVAITPFGKQVQDIRHVLFYNNPNQLGYYSLLCASIFLAASKKYNISIVIEVLFLLGCFILAALSLSKAAMGGILILTIIVLWKRPIFILITIIMIAIGVRFIADIPLYKNINTRISSIGKQSDDTLEARGYGRIKNNLIHCILGASEGAVYRFSNDRKMQIEIHSSWGTILFSYGIFGTITFMLFMIKIYDIARMSIYIYLAPVIFYGITHQGLRAALFWILIAMIICLSVKDKNYKDRNMVNNAH